MLLRESAMMLVLCFSSYTRYLEHVIVAKIVLGIPQEAQPG
jgi:hypothetical protein